MADIAHTVNRVCGTTASAPRDGDEYWHENMILLYRVLTDDSLLWSVCKQALRIYRANERKREAKAEAARIWADIEAQKLRGRDKAKQTREETRRKKLMELEEEVLDIPFNQDVLEKFARLIHVSKPVGVPWIQFARDLGMGQNPYRKYIYLAKDTDLMSCGALIAAADSLGCEVIIRRKK